MLGNRVSQIQNSLSSVENRLGNLETLFIAAFSLPDLTKMEDFIQTEGDTTVPEVRHPIRSLCQATKNYLLV